MKTQTDNNIRFDFKGAYAETPDTIHLYFQRQGVSQTCNIGHPVFFAEYSDNKINKYFSAEVAYSCNFERWKQDNGQIISHRNDFKTLEDAKAFIIEQVGKLTGKTITIDDQIICYCYGWYPYDYQQADKFLSSAVYEAGTDTIRHAVTNVCLVAFNEGVFSSPNLEVDRAAIPYRKQIDEAINSGWHKCDTDKGEDYCKRRLAWLIGCYINEQINEGSARWCNLDMSKYEPWAVKSC